MAEPTPRDLLFALFQLIVFILRQLIS